MEAKSPLDWAVGMTTEWEEEINMAKAAQNIPSSEEEAPKPVADADKKSYMYMEDEVNQFEQELGRMTRSASTTDEEASARVDDEPDQTVWLGREVAAFEKGVGTYIEKKNEVRKRRENAAHADTTVEEEERHIPTFLKDEVEEFIKINS